ncbi:ribosome assembly RNA-binding protein YhbY [Kurthia sibirica]|uniref:Ribosome assembly RNA-binding protein YhbY n=1 Tax=Kurthia sibirica TaxID=202750 RepID=A0A2U3AK13_9BACL|nr:ribosome assembly RNA-binding protein YhbY [Kurthia sibirica]PWI24834.1 ribosome assembly RNA-binding protein YhbY [Kurthia sibirica]GEK33318.1 RNA-binding protein [Kurthia sibirica]
MLTSKQKRFLRAEAHHLDPIFQVGKGGISEAMLVQIKQAINVRELIKVRILDNCEFDKHEVAADLAEGTDTELVQLIGLTVVLYKQATKREHRRIELPKAK